MGTVPRQDHPGAAPADLRVALEAAIGTLENAEEAVVVAGADTLAVLAVNRAGRELLDGREAVGRPLAWLFPDEDATEVHRRLRALVSTGGRSMGLTARPVWDDRAGRRVAVRLDVVTRGDVPLVVAFMRSSPEDRAVAAARDTLASMPGRDALFTTLDAEMRRAFRYGRDLAVVAVRLSIPSGLGATGESEGAVLGGVYERLRGAVRGEEVVGRLDRRDLAWVLPETGAEGARVAAESGVGIAVGVAALTRGDSPRDLLRRAQDDAEGDPGPGRRAARSDPALADEAAALLRAAGDGDARAVDDLVGAAFARHGHARGYDEVLQAVMMHLGRSGAEEGPERSAGQHRAAALVEWAVGRRSPVHPPPDGPVAVLVPFGVDVRRVTLPSVCDAAAAAGWMPLVVQVPPAADVAVPAAALGARCIVLVVGDDADLVDAGHLVPALAERMPDVPVLVAAAPGGILRRWRPPSPAVPVASAVLLQDLLGSLAARPAP